MKYEVTLARRVYGSVVVEADSAREAEDLVFDMMREPFEMDESYEPGDWEILYAYNEEKDGAR